MPLRCQSDERSRRRWALLLALIVVLAASPTGITSARDVIAPQATLTIQPNHGPCDEDVIFVGSGFVPGSEVVLRPLYSASGDPYPDGPVYSVTPDPSGSFSLRASPCPRSVPVAGQTVLWSAEPPGRPYFVSEGPFGLAEFIVFDPDATRSFPETGHSVRGEFLYTWERSGGLPVFGFPLTGERDEEGQTVQYFERQRFELHPEYADTPYEVLLGRLGDELLRAQGRDWRSFPTADPSQPYYFVETDHAIDARFASYWSSYGLEFGDPGVSFRESLALFGYPLSEPMVETNADGDTVLTQYFERAVFGWHPQNPDPWKVLLRRVGVEVMNLQGASTGMYNRKGDRLCEQQ